MTQLSEVLSLVRVASGEHRAMVDGSWLQGRGAYGGLVAALLARAIEAETPGGQRLARITTAFAAPLLAGASTVEVERVRAGRNVSSFTATLRGHDGAPVASALATAIRAREHPLCHHGAVMPSVPPPSEVADGPEEHYWPVFARHFSFRQCLGPRPFSGACEPRVGGWCRANEEAPIDAARMIALLDAWPPAAAALSPGPCPVASLEMTVELAAPRTDAGPWLLYDAVSDRIEGGLANERAALFSEGGALVARSQQIIALFPSAPSTPEAGGG